MEMKIVYVMETMSIRGGLERIMSEKINYFADNLGYDITLLEVYSFSNGRKGRGEDPEQGDAFRISEKVHRVRLGIRKKSLKPLKIFTFLKVAKMVANEIDRLRPNIMISASLIGVIVFSLKKYPCRTIFESHQNRGTMPLQFLMKRMEQNVDCVVTLTQGDAKEYTLAKKVSVIPNFNTVYPFSPNYRHQRTKEIVAIGRLCKEKGYDFLLEAWSRIITHLPDYRLCIYGDGKERDALLSLIAKLNISDSVSLLPSSGDVYSIYRSADLLLLTSHCEGFSLVLVEAMAYGVPVVAVDVPYGPREILSEKLPESEYSTDDFQEVPLIDFSNLQRIMELDFSNPSVLLSKDFKKLSSFMSSPFTVCKGGVLVERDVLSFVNAVLKILKNNKLYSALSSSAPSVNNRYSKDSIIPLWCSLFSDIMKQ